MKQGRNINELAAEFQIPMRGNEQTAGTPESTGQRCFKSP